MASRRIKIGSAIFSAMFLLTSSATMALADDKANTQDSASQPAPKKKHSKAKGALVGGAGGAVVGGKKGAAVGAVGGALVQHHKNKKEAKEQEKAQKKE